MDPISHLLLVRDGKRTRSEAWTRVRMKSLVTAHSDLEGVHVYPHVYLMSTPVDSLDRTGV